MRDDAEPSLRELRRQRAHSAGPDNAAAITAPTVIETTVRAVGPARPLQSSQASTRAAQETQVNQFDRSRSVDALRQRWHWLVLAAACCALIGGAFCFLRPTYTLPVT